MRTLFGIDLRTLALFRVLLGLYVLMDLVLRARDLTDHYTDTGIMPRAVQISQLRASSWSLHLGNGSAFFEGLLFAVAALAAIGLILGWRTRLMTAVSWALLLSVQNRNTFILSGEDNLALLLMFWGMFLPLGARYSLDRALSRTRDYPDNAYFSMATAALLIQGMSMYFFSALLKTHPVWVPDGNAVYYALQLDYLVTPFSLWFRQFQDAMTGLTYYVYTLELIGPFLIFSPIFHRTFRTLIMVAFMTMHFAFFFFLEIGLFPYISIVMNLTFMPSWMWDAIAGRLIAKPPARITLWYDQGCTFCEKTCHILRVFLFLPKAAIRPAQEDPEIGAELAARNSWVVTIGDDRFFKAGGLIALLSASRVFRPLAAVLNLYPFRRSGDWCYDLVGRHRGGLSRITAQLLPWRERTVRIGLPTQVLAAFFLGFITVQNISTLPASPYSLPDAFISLRQALGLYQNWTMFAPYPEMNSPWPVIPGKLTDGTQVDVYNSRLGPAVFRKPAVVSRVYANYRWRKFLSNLEDRSYETGPQILALNYARFLCRDWSRHHPDLPALSTFKIYFQVEDTPPPGGSKVPKPRLVWSHDCFG
ncbi:HTTM domain-containing protein [Roseibium aggregatum]|uniref:HTTM domain-containing protein n=1 Tax=Roseibium aggregatum TaxID=187304 RepID=A0A926NVP9_9HYPH|nr:HTTM domain-containing protein [Roseibium aggregatum]MBD1546119.1 HTTM domain-containing protein [Roseibium aggregatum]